MDMQFGTWKVRSLCRVGLLMTVVKDRSKYKLHLMGMQKIRWDRMALKQQAYIHFSGERGMRIVNWGFFNISKSYQQVRG
jgi:hypothetical protein